MTPVQKPRKTIPKAKNRLARNFIENKKEVIKTRGIYLLPSLFTVANIFCGFYAIVTLMNYFGAPDNKHLLVNASLLIMLAAFLDGIDGRVAKMTKSTSEFGAQLDSLADVISFGVAPGLLVYSWALSDYGRLGWLPAFLFLVCGALRLARFNVDAVHNHDIRYFKGLPIPFGALMIASSVILKPEISPKGFLSLLIMIIVYVLAYLMISTIPYRSFKDIDLREKKSAKVIFFIALFFVFVFLEPSLMVFLLVLLYILAGILNNLITLPFSIDKTIHRDILPPPQEFDNCEVIIPEEKGEATE